MARKTIIAGNWKMNLLPQQGEDLVAMLKDRLVGKENLEVILLPQTAMVALAADWIVDSSLQLGAQNCAEFQRGAYTGETSPELLQVLGCRYCLAGHSERRELFGETDEQVGRKAGAMLAMGITPIVCVGETLKQRESGQFLTVVGSQVEAIYHQIAPEAWTRLVFAYEPVWAIGTGETATPAQANAVHRHIRQTVEAMAGSVVAAATTILYGGSANPSNAADLLAEVDIDGLLVGGASLKADDFLQIISSC
jgi:triosephosphate isomerase (TIM)